MSKLSDMYEDLLYGNCNVRFSRSDVIREYEREKIREEREEERRTKINQEYAEEHFSRM